MEKTSVYLTNVERQRLAWLADSTGRSQADIIREAIRSYAPAPSGDRDFALAGVGETTAAAGSIADEDEVQALEGFGE